MRPSTYTDSKIQRASLLIASLLLFIIAPRPSYAQSTVVVTSAASPSISTMSGPPPSMTTSFTTSASHIITSVTSHATKHPTPPLLRPAGASSDEEELERETQEGVFNYYFLILAGFGVMVGVTLWYIRKQRIRRKERMRLSGQNALARDMEGWVNTRRWMHGAWRHNQTAGLIRREEGLNEHGEAPPPYEPNNVVSVPHNGAGEQDPASGLTIPMRVLSRDGVQSSGPPKYEETTIQPDSSITRSDTATSHAVRTDTVDSHSNDSTRALLRDGRPQTNG